MKSAKKILLGIVVASIFVCCFALSSSAGDSSTAVKDLEKAYEYFDTVYLAVDYQDAIPEGETSVAYVRNTHKSPSSYVSFASSATSRNGTSYLCYEDGSDNVAWNFVYTSTGTQIAKYYTTNTFETSEFVVSLRVKMDGKDADGNAVGGSILKITTNKSDNLFELDMTDPLSSTVSYGYFNTKGNFELTAVEGRYPELDRWYTVQLALNYNTGTYTVNFIDEADDLNSWNSGELSLGNKDVSTSLDVLLYDVVDKSVSWIDDVYVYDGTFVRDIDGANQIIENALIKAETLSNDTSLSVEDKVLIANFYQKAFSADSIYTPVEESDNYEAIVAIKDGWEAYFNTAYATAFAEYANELTGDGDIAYYDRVEKSEYAKTFDDYFADDKETLLTLPGISETGENGTYKADDIILTKTKYAQALDKIATIEEHTNRYVNVMAGYDFTNKYYSVMKELLLTLADYSMCDPEYKYSEENEIDEEDYTYKYTTAAVAIAERDEIAKIFAEIDSNVNTFVDAVGALPNPDAQDFNILSNFGTGYANYLKANAVYTGDSVHEMLDVSTHPRCADIESALVKFAKLADKYIAKANECETFIEHINKALTSNTYKYTLEELDKAEPYIATVSYEYAGVTEAKTSYDALRQTLATNRSNATAYITAVNAIDMNASYSALRAAVDAAAALKENGNVVGIDGVQEANIAYAKAEAKVISLEGNSETLIAAVESLKTATGLAERRELIAIASNAKDKAEPSISGVNEAKTELEAQIAKYSEEISAINTAFASVITNTVDSVSASAPTANVYKSADVIKAMFK